MRVNLYRVRAEKPPARYCNLVTPRVKEEADTATPGDDVNEKEEEEGRVVSY